MRYILALLLLFSLPAMAAQKPEAVKSPAGLSAWVIEDHYLPIVSVKLAFSASGYAYDPTDKLGLAYMVASLLDEGSGGMSSLDYRKKLEELATGISFSTTEDGFYVTVKTLSGNLAESLKIVNTALTQANFDPNTVERIRNQILVIQAKQEEDPEYLAMRKFKETLFNNHPYSNPKYGTGQTLPRITRDDLLSFVKQNFISKNVLISIVGDVKSKDMPKLLDSSFKLFEKQAGAKELPPVQISTTGQTIYIEKDIPQSVVIFGGAGVKRSDKNFYPAYVMNHILGGGGFESRLMEEVREKNGLAYTVYSYLDLLNEAGLFVGYVGTDGSKVAKSIDLIKQQLGQMASNGVTEEDAKNAKDYLINSFPLKMTRNSSIAEFLSVMQEENLGMDFLQKRNDYIKNAPLMEINESATALLNPDNLTFIVVGKRN